MITSRDLEVYLDTYLSAQSILDYAPNGLQIAGRAEISRLCTAVSISQEVITKAADWQADAILVHHGFFWRGEPSVLTGVRRQRIASLLSQGINLLAYHLPLDVHLELGNNACIAQRLQVTDVSQHDVDKLPKGLWAGSLPQALQPEDCAALLTTVFKQPPHHIVARRSSIRRIAWCSGAAQDYLEAAAPLGVDAYISGEISERTFDLAKELNIHYFACGHHATERYGVQALGSHVADMFGLSHCFIHTDNPV